MATGARIVVGCAFGCFAFGMLAMATLFLLPKGCHNVDYQYRSGPAVHQKTPALGVRKVRMAVILAKFRDKPAETRPPSYYRDYYTRFGTGGQADYWRDVTLGAIDLSESEVFGWYTMTHDSDEVKSLVFPGGRGSLVQWGKDAATAAGVHLSKFDAVLVVQNWGVDHGAAAGGLVIVDQNRELIEPTFVSHEMGHLFGLPHSFGEPGVSPCISDNGEYCDAWDIMSAMNVFSYTGTFQEVDGRFGPGLNVFGTKALGGLPAERMRTIRSNGIAETIELAPLNQPLQQGAIYAVLIPPYTIEYRHKAGWDRGLPSDAVLVHLEKNGRSYLERTPGDAGLHTGDRFTTDSPKIEIEVQSIDPAAQRAVVRLSVIKSSAP